MFNGQIFYQGNEISIAQAILLNLITQDGFGDIFLKIDNGKRIRVSGILRIG